LRPATLAVAAGRPQAVPGAAVNPPIWLTSTYVGGGEVDYGRTDNPTWQAFEQALGALEGGSAAVFSSGMAAITAALSLVPDGSLVVSPRHAYSGTGLLLAQAAQRGRLTVRQVDVADTEATLSALDGAAMVWLESPTNPMMEIADLATISAAARAVGAIVVVDNTFATPLG